jgi:hypothetical protein
MILWAPHLQFVDASKCAELSSAAELHHVQPQAALEACPFTPDELKF